MTTISKDDLEEILQHIQEITREKANKNEIPQESDVSTNVMNNVKEPLYTSSPSSRNEIVSQRDVPWRWVYNSLETCDICKQVFVLEKNPSGLVIAGEYFACEHCCQTLPKEDLLNWTKSRMAKPSDVRSIGIWLNSRR